MAGDNTNLVVTKNFEEAQRHCDDILSLLCDEYLNVYVIPGNRDRMGSYSNGAGPMMGGYFDADILHDFHENQI